MLASGAPTSMKGRHKVSEARRDENDKVMNKHSRESPFRSFLSYVCWSNTVEMHKNLLLELFMSYVCFIAQSDRTRSALQMN